MKGFIKAFVGKGYKSKNLRGTALAGIITYIMIMIFIFPVFSAVAEAPCENNFEDAVDVLEYAPKKVQGEADCTQYCGEEGEANIRTTDFVCDTQCAVEQTCKKEDAVAESGEGLSAAEVNEDIGINWALLLGLLLFTPVGGTLAQTIVSVSSYASLLIASVFDSDIRKDMKGIMWNPLNANQKAVFDADKVSFYKGVPIIITQTDRAGSFGIIIFDEFLSDSFSLNHERGHNTQLSLMGLFNYAFTVGIPSPLELGGWSQNNNYYGAPWETMANILGGVCADNTQDEIANALLYYAASALCFPLAVLSWRYYYWKL